MASLFLNFSIILSFLDFSTDAVKKKKRKQTRKKQKQPEYGEMPLLPI